MTINSRVRFVPRSLLVCALCLCAGCPPSGVQPKPPSQPPLDLSHQLGNRDLRVDPPRFDRLFVKRMDGAAGGNALLVAQANANERLPDKVAVRIDDAVVDLHDDGQNGDAAARDGRYSAFVRIDPAELDAAQKQMQDLAQARPFVVFDGRRARTVDPRSLLDGAQDLVNQGFLLFFPFPFPFPLPTPPDIARSLLVLDPAVVDDPGRTFDPCGGPNGTPAGTAGGKWTFQHLITEMTNQAATGIDPSDFARHWVNRWSFNQTINDFTVAQRNTGNLLGAWPTLPNGKLDLARAPFRLLAIVNRVDLRENLVYGPGSAGEARFVFGVVGRNCSVLPFTVIFEYGIQKNGCVDLRDWARQWLNLSTLPLGSPAYNAALEAITEQFVAANAAPAKPNGSALNQLRTNEIALGAPWELRENRIFDTDSDAHLLREVTVKQTPDLTLDNTGVLANYLSANAATIPSQKHVVPLEFPPGSAFLGGSALEPTPSFFWNAPGNPPYPVRSNFSLATCNGCHTGETRTTFTHIAPRAAHAPAALSQFLTGTVPDVADPAGTANSAHFADLQRRQNDLAVLAGSSCFRQILFSPLRMVH